MGGDEEEWKREREGRRRRGNKSGSVQRAMARSVQASTGSDKDTEEGETNPFQQQPFLKSRFGDGGVVGWLNKRMKEDEGDDGRREDGGERQRWERGKREGGSARWSCARTGAGVRRWTNVMGGGWWVYEGKQEHARPRSFLKFDPRATSSRIAPIALEASTTTRSLWRLLRLSLGHRDSNRKIRTRPAKERRVIQEISRDVGKTWTSRDEIWTSR